MIQTLMPAIAVFAFEIISGLFFGFITFPRGKDRLEETSRYVPCLFLTVGLCDVYSIFAGRMLAGEMNMTYAALVTGISIAVFLVASWLGRIVAAIASVMTRNAGVAFFTVQAVGYLVLGMADVYPAGFFMAAVISIYVALMIAIHRDSAQPRHAG